MADKRRVNTVITFRLVGVRYWSWKLKFYYVRNSVTWQLVLLNQWN